MDLKTIARKETETFILVAKETPDKMKLFIDVEPTQKLTASRDQLLASLGEILPAKACEQAVIDDIVKRLRAGEKVTERRIAKGVAPIPGSDGKLLYLVKKFTGQGEVSVDAKGFANFFELHLFDNVTKGQPVARIYHPKSGTDGLDVYGAVLTAQPGKPAQIKLDKSVTAETVSGEEFDLVKAEVDGFVSEENGTMWVKTDLVIKGDVDLHFGNIDFIGRIIVQGDVMPRLIVRGKLGVEVGGSAREAILESVAGPVQVKGFLYGGPRGRILAAEGLTASVAQEIKVETKGDIIIEKEALDCTLFSQSSVRAPKGKIVGGATYVVCGAEAKIFGNDAGKATVIHLCRDVEASTEYAEIMSRLESHDKALVLMKMHLGPYADKPARIELLKEPHRAKMTGLRNKMAEVERSRELIEKKRQDILAGAKSSRISRVGVHESLYPLVTIKAGEKEFQVKERLAGPAGIEFDPNLEEFKVGEFKDIVCDLEPSKIKEEKPDDAAK